MHAQDGIFIPYQLIAAFANAVLLIVIVVLAGWGTYVVIRLTYKGVSRALRLKRMSKVERCRDYLLKHDEDYRHWQSARTMLRSAGAHGPTRFRHFPMLRMPKRNNAKAK